MSYRDNPSLNKEEAIQLHNDALVIDSQQPPITSGALFTKNMKTTLDEWFKDGMTRGEARGHLSNMIAVTAFGPFLIEHLNSSKGSLVD